MRPWPERICLGGLALEELITGKIFEEPSSLFIFLGGDIGGGIDRVQPDECRATRISGRLVPGLGPDAARGW